MEFITDGIDAVLETLQGLLGGIGASSAEFFTSLVLNETGGLNALGLFTFMLLGIAITFGIVGWITSLVRNRR